MHSRIYQLETDEKNLLKRGTDTLEIPEWFSYFADYWDEVPRSAYPEEQEEFFTFMKGIGCVKDEGKVAFTEEAIERYFRGKYDFIKREVADLAFENFLNGYKCYELCQALEDRYP